ncbi:ATP-binding response regulator [Longimicrobium sp.]|jgi:PAS domain S-box-containing protein|uniref:ATP-binding response regulator n=1 Tax=Longimicrobium sp. TaxID=2029185 RepID=UPI002EDB5BB3
MEPEETLRILIVDDDQVDRMAVRRALRAGGVTAEVTDAVDVASALDAVKGEPFDCVFLDYNLPGGDGLRVLRGMRESGVDAPVIMLTGQQDTQTAVGLMKEGASDYLQKDGLTPERLAQSLRHAVRLFRAEAQAREAEIRFRTVQETSPDAFVVLHSVRGADGAIQDFRFEYLNPAACRMLGRTPEELRGRAIIEEYPGNLDAGLFRLYADVVETGEPRESEVHYAHDGLDLWLRVTAVKLGDGIAVGAADISGRKRAEQEREHAVQARSRFYTVMSHELRTPINAILGYNDLVLAEVFGPVAGGIQESIERSQRATRHLLELVNDVLDLSKLEAGKMEIASEPVHVPQLIEELLSTVRPVAESRNTPLDVAEGDCPDPIITDPRRVRQILLNLVSNAIKFGEGKPVVIRCKRREGGWMELEVVDMGLGIPAEDLPRIFDEFVQLPNSAEGGTGLGLPISQRLAQLLGGELQAESTPGAGSLFRLRLPAVHPGHVAVN